jgi:ribose/xylose/arabinose/galactoside ABC-type transport system permease subunit
VTATSIPGRAAGGRRRLAHVLEVRETGLILAIVVVVIVITLLNRNFASPGNILGLLRAMSSLAIIALAQTLVIIAGELDLSVGAVYGLAATTTAIVWLNGWPLAAALIIAFVMAVAVGIVNGFFTTVVRIPSFIATLGMLSFVRGMELFIGGARGYNPAYAENYGYQRPPDIELEVFRSLGYTRLPFNIPIQVLWMTVLAFVFRVVLHRTLFGFRLLAIGGNQEASRVARLPARRYKFAVFIISALVASLAGLLDFSFLGSVEPGSGLDLTFPVFAAVIVGGASLTGGRGSIVGTIVGVLLLATLQNGLSLLGVGPYLSLMFVGVVTIGAVTLDRLSQTLRSRRR